MPNPLLSDSRELLAHGYIFLSSCEPPLFLLDEPSVRYNFQDGLESD